MMSKSRLNSNSNSIPNESSHSEGYRPSVPISIYRELAAELQTTQSRLDSLYEQNQALTQENKQLRTEIHKVLHSTQHLQKVLQFLDGHEPIQEFAKIPSPPQPKPVSSSPPKAVSASSPKPNVPPALLPTDESQIPEFQKPEKLVAEVQPPQPSASETTKKSAGLNNWLLFLTIVLLVITAFGTGFLIVRPMLNNNSDS